MIEIDKYIIGLFVAVIAYFLRMTMSDLRRIKDEVDKHRSEIMLLQQEARTNKDYFNEKFEVLFREIREIHVEIKNLINK